VRCRICGAQLPDGAMFCGDCGSSTSATPESRRRPDPRPGDTTAIEPPPRRNSGVISVPVDGFHAASPILDPAESSAGAVARPRGTQPRFVLEFSTGETRTVFGTGLIGRKPLPQPGESFDQLVQIADRFSGNGTIVRRPDDGALRCEPGRRYLVPRGSRVELAQQFFTVE